MLLNGHLDLCFASGCRPARLNPPIDLVGEPVTSTQLVAGRCLVLVSRFLLVAIGGAVGPVMPAPVTAMDHLIPHLPIAGLVGCLGVIYGCAYEWLLLLQCPDLCLESLILGPQSLHLAC